MTYTGAVLIQATVGAAKAVIPQKQVAAAAGGTLIRSVLPSISGDTSNVMLNLGTELVYQYIMKNKGGVVNVANFREATLMLEPFFGPNFSQISPPSFDNAPTLTQENLIVMIQAFNSLLSPPYNYTLAYLITIDPSTGYIGLGDTAPLAALNAAIAAARTTLISNGTISNTYQAPTIIPLTQGTVIASLSDTTPPVGPTILTYDDQNSTYNKVILTWNAATDNVKVTAYNVYRDGVLVFTTTSLTYTDTTVNDSTTYTYEVQARDAAGNLSDGKSITVTTKAIPVFTISGKITLNGAPFPNVSVTLAGSGTAATVTDASGNYSFTGVRSGNYTITPSIAGYFFAPTFRLLSITTANATAQDFAAVPSGTVNGGTTYPTGTVITTITNPDGTVTTTITYPNGTVTTTTTYPSGTVNGGTTYPTGTVTTTTTNPDGTVTTTITYPNGTVTVVTTYPNGTVTTATTYPDGTVTTGTTYPNGTVTTATTFPDGTVTLVTTYPNGSVSTVTTFPNGTVTTGTTYPNGTVTVITTYPNGTVTTATTFPDGSVTTTTNYPNGTVTTGTTYPLGTVGAGVIYPGGNVISSLGFYKIVYGTVTGTVNALPNQPLVGIGLVFTDSILLTQTTATTSFAGTYYFIGVLGHTYTVTPKISGSYTFTPSSFTVPSNINNDANLNINITGL
jgi:antitoxin component YwqK of YwqJK toxin-antitoxin module